MERQTAAVLEGIFGGLCVLFSFLWLFLGLYPAVPIVGETENLPSAFWNIYFFGFIFFCILSVIFGDIKKRKDSLIQARQILRDLVPLSQQQQQVITVPVPTHPALVPPQSKHRPLSIPDSDVIICSACVSQNRKDAPFCKVCGVSID